MPAMLSEAARCWREARDKHQPVQPSLFALLSRHGHDMLAPVLDSLMTLAEAVAGKRFTVGSGPDLSEDEQRLIGLLEGTGGIPREGGLTPSLDCAVRSLQILMTLPVGMPATHLAA